MCVKPVSASLTVIALIEKMTTLRRRGQALDRCDALRRLRNQYTMINRKLKTLLRTAKDQNQREKIRYGPLGVELKRNIKDAWWRDMVSCHDDSVALDGTPDAYQMTGLDCTIIMHPQVWKCSGHYDLFHDEMVDCRESKRRYRYDQVRGRWVEAKGKRKFLVPGNAQTLLRLAEVVEAVEPFTQEPLDATVKAWLEENELPMKVVAQPARVAMTGRTRSPGLFEVMEVLGKEKTLARLRAAAEIAAATETPSA